jgi:hypothetical protein
VRGVALVEKGSTQEFYIAELGSRELIGDNHPFGIID